VSVLALAALLCGCAGVAPAARPAGPPALATLAPAAWQAPWPHGGEVQALGRWWQRFDDPLLVELVTAAQAAAPTVASATSRIAQARAARVAAEAALQPRLDSSASAARGRQDLSLPVGTSLSAGVQASWELDLFGGLGAGRDAAVARLEGARADWHDARVAVAAEVATAYVSLRACEAQALQNERDAQSRAETARLTELASRSGFRAPADAALARGSAASAAATLAAQRASCELERKGLVALTALDEAALRARLAAGAAQVPQPAAAGLGAAPVPAQALAQRPDLRSAEQAVLASAAAVGEAEARRLPRIALNGSLGVSRVTAEGFSAQGSTWAIGPVQVTLPIFDGGSLRAGADAARARYDEAGALYRARLRNAVREVEAALVRLQGSSEQTPLAQAALDGFEAALRATEARYRGGLASQFELEDARRTAVQAATRLVGLQRERATAWVELYRALGGGWEAADLDAPERQAAGPARADGARP
jgi:NodT family efflux transporter outer membrane factor (OMF) lipoprotein